MARRKPFNPFYLLLVVVGTAFCVTACAYGVATLRALQPVSRDVDPRSRETPLTQFMDRNGQRLLIGELLLLAAATIGAISTDGYWQRRAASASSQEETPS